MKHCWHAGGFGTSYFTGGEDTHFCCYCGKSVGVPWHLGSRPMEGHGPRAFEQFRVYDWPTDECPQRAEDSNG